MRFPIRRIRWAVPLLVLLGATAARRAEKVAAQVPLKEGIHFIRARALIRKALAEDGISGRIDKLVERLLG